MKKMTPGRRQRLMANINKLRARLAGATATEERVALMARIASLRRAMRSG